MGIAIVSHRRGSSASALTALACLLPFGVSVALPHGAAAALAPDNDVRAGAIQISGIPFAHTQDTSEATVDAGEDVARDLCLGVGAPAFEHAVWFRADVTESGTRQLIVDVTASSYGAGIAVLQDTSDGLVPIACQGGTFVTSPSVQPGTYYLVVFGDGTTPTTAGELVVTIDVAAPPPEVDVSIDPAASATKDGALRLSGTLTCTSSDALQPVFLDAEVTQRIGRFIIRSWVAIELWVACDSATVAWDAVAVPENGTFAGGRAVVRATAFVCTADQCGGDETVATVKVRRSR